MSLFFTYLGIKGQKKMKKLHLFWKMFLYVTFPSHFPCILLPIRDLTALIKSMNFVSYLVWYWKPLKYYNALLLSTFYEEVLRTKTTVCMYIYIYIYIYICIYSEWVIKLLNSFCLLSQAKNFVKIFLQLPPKTSYM